MRTNQIKKEFDTEISYQPPLLDEKLSPMIPRIGKVQSKKDHFRSYTPIYANGYYVLEGSGKISINNNSYIYHPGDAFINFEGDLFEHHLEKGARYYWFNLTGENIPDYFYELGLNEKDRYLGKSLDLLPLCDEMFEKYDKDCLSRIQKISYFWLFLRNAENNIEYSLPCKIKRLVDQVYSTPVNIDYLARQLGISSCYLQQQFKKTYQTTVKQYINQRRVQYGSNLLRFSNYPVKEIAIMVGFESPETFIRVFRKKMGNSPLQWRKKLIN